MCNKLQFYVHILLESKVVSVANSSGVLSLAMLKNYQIKSLRRKNGNYNRWFRS